MDEAEGGAGRGGRHVPWKIGWDCGGKVLLLFMSLSLAPIQPPLAPCPRRQAGTSTTALTYGLLMDVATSENEIFFLIADGTESVAPTR